MKVHSTCTLAGTQLVGVREGVLQEFHDGDDAGGLVFNALDRGTLFAQVGEEERDATATLGEL